MSLKTFKPVRWTQEPEALRSRAALLLILLLGAGLRLYRLDGQSLWYDELTTINRAAMPVKEMLDNLLAIHNHVPLYFLFMRGWLHLGNNAFIARYFSVIWGVMTLALIFRTGYFLYGRKVGLTAAALLAITPFHIWYSQEARMYAFLTAVILLVHWFLVRLLRRESRWDWLGYTLSMLLAVYTHYFALLILLAHYIFFALHYRRLKSLFWKWMAYSSLIAALFLVWIRAIMSATGLGSMVPGWITTIHALEPALTLLSFSVGPTIDSVQWFWYVPAAIYLCGLVVAYWLSARKVDSLSGEPNRWADQALWSWLLIPPLIVYLVSLRWSSARQVAVYMDRYLIIVLPAMILLAARGLVYGGQRRRWLWLVSVLLVAVFAALSLKNMYFDPDYAREDWQETAVRLAQELRSGDVVLVRPDLILPLAYYVSTPLQIIELPAAVNQVELAAAFDDEMRYRLIHGADHAPRAWLITLFYNGDTHGFPQARNAAVAHPAENSQQYAWMDAHGRLLREWTFTGIRLSLFDITPITRAESDG